MAVAAAPSRGSFAVLVVCDGVSSAPDSDRASLAAARAARDVLARAAGARRRRGRPASRGAPAAAQAAADVAPSRAGWPTGRQPAVARRSWRPSSHGGRRRRRLGRRQPGVLAARRGTGRAEQLTVDDSWAAEAMALGVPREEAESGPERRTRSRAGSAPTHPTRARGRCPGRSTGPAGCCCASDGLWNYCSEAADPRRAASADTARARAGPPRELAAGARAVGRRGRAAPTTSASRSRASRLDAGGSLHGPVHRRGLPERVPAAGRHRRPRDRDGHVLGRRRGGARRGRRRGRDRHHRHLGLDAGRALRGRAAGRVGGDRPDPRRHLVRRHRRHRPGRPRLPVPQRRVPDGPDGAGRPRRGEARRPAAARPAAARRWAPGCGSPRSCSSSVPRRPSGTPSCSRTARTRASRRVALQEAIRTAQGVFQCDCRGVGADWDVRELRGRRHRPARDRRPRRGARRSWRRPSRRSCATRWGAAWPRRALRVWAPQGAQVLFVRQVAPQVEDLTGRRQDVNAADRRLPDRGVGRREPRLPRGRPARRQARRGRAARGPGAARRRRPGGRARRSSRRCGPTTTR